jgi:type II secretory pathway component PulC
MFGSAGRAKQEEQAAPAPAIEETELHLKLLGTAATTPKDPFASATIMNVDDNSSIRVYGVGQAVVDQVTLEEIHQRRVVLFNKIKNRRETLRTEEDKAVVAQVAAVQPGKAPSAPAPPPNHVSVKKTELVQDLFMNYNEIVTQIKPEIYKDSSGKVAGITASNLESLPLAAKLNVKNGDVLQSVNGDMIDSEAKIMELINKYRNATSVNIGLLRDGRPITINYRLE